MSKNRNPWTEEVTVIQEDLCLGSLVQELGNSKWELVAKSISKRLNTLPRSGKQCRERWHNHLNPHINRNAWTESEKTDNSVKNFFYSKLRKEDRKKKRKTCIDFEDFDKDATDILFQLSRETGFRRVTQFAGSETEEGKELKKFDCVFEKTMEVMGINF